MNARYPNLDEDLLEEAMAYIEQNPEDHNQYRWAQGVQSKTCPTRFCYAGWVAILSGAQPPLPDTNWYIRMEDGVSTGPEGGGLFISDYAALKLGLAWRDATSLFHSANSVEQLRVMVDKLKAGEEI